MNNEKAPTRLAGESPGRFMRRTLGYLTEPHRRRLGHETEMEMLRAIQELEEH